MQRVSSIVSRFLRQSPRLYDLSLFVRVRMLGIMSRTVSWLCRIDEKHIEGIQVLQLGANDGLRNDPVRFFTVWRKWTGLLVEPVPEAFNSLVRNYKSASNHNLQLRNCGVSLKSGSSLLLYRMDQKWLESLDIEKRNSLLRKTSFSKDHLASFLLPEDAKWIIEEHYPAFTLSELVELAGFDSVKFAVLVMDLEGFEYDIIASNNFRELGFGAVVFECAHLEGGRAEQVKVILSQQGYRVTFDGVDAIAELEQQ
jgi:FkbM family methyltransferase